MTSWRDSTSQQAQDDLDRLLGAILPFAEGRLTAEGGFHPFGVILDSSGEAAIVSADPTENHEPKADDILAALIHDARENLDGTRAAAFVTDVVADGSNAIRIELEHKEGAAVMVLRDYELDETDGSAPVFGELTAYEGTPVLWNAE